jgi:hypothetical protein
VLLQCKLSMEHCMTANTVVARMRVRLQSKVRCALTISCIVAAATGHAGVAWAQPSSSGRDDYKQAVVLEERGEYENALTCIERGLVTASADLRIRLLGLKGAVLLKLRDYAAARAVYQTYLNTGAIGAGRREAQKIINSLSAVESTFLDITITNGPAIVYLDSKTRGAFCKAEPSCRRAILPGNYTVIAERPGFERWSGNFIVQNGDSTRLTIALIETPSLLTVRVTPAGAQVTVDGAAYNAPAKVAAGTHRVVVVLAGPRDTRIDAEAHAGKPVEIDVALTPVTPLHLVPYDAALVLDGQAVAVEDGGIAIPPGEHRLVARAKGHVERSITIAADRPRGVDLVIELERIPVRSGPPSVFTPARKIAIAAGGLAVTAATAGTILGLQSNHYKDDAFALCPSASVECSDASRANHLYARGRLRALQADISFGVAGVAAIAATVLWFTGAPESRVAISPRVGALAGLDLMVRF